MTNFEFYSPTKIYFGLNRETEVGAIIKQYGFHKILLHYGKSSTYSMLLLLSEAITLSYKPVFLIELLP